MTANTQSRTLLADDFSQIWLKAFRVQLLAMALDIAFDTDRLLNFGFGMDCSSNNLQQG